MTKKLENLRDLLIHEIRDLHDAETRIITLLPKMREKTSDEELKDLFQEYYDQAELQLERLEAVCRELETDPSGTESGLKGTIQQGERLMKVKTNSGTMDTALIAVVQKITHYQIAGYRTANSYAELLGLPEIRELLNVSWEEEREVNQRLTDIARTVHPRAIAA